MVERGVAPDHADHRPTTGEDPGIEGAAGQSTGPWRVVSRQERRQAGMPCPFAGLRDAVDHQARDGGDQQEASVFEHPGVPLRDLEDGPGEEECREVRPHHPGQLACPGPDRSVHPDGHGQDDAGEQGMGPGVGAVVDAGRVSLPWIQVPHPPCGERGTGDHGDQQRHVGPLPEERQHGDQVQRGEYVELLLDGERPHVAERRELEVLEVRDVGEDLVPVGAVGEGREDRSGPSCEFARRNHQDQVDCQHAETQEEGWEQASGPPPRVGLQVDAAGRLELV